MPAPGVVVQIMVDRGDGKRHVFNCSREPVLRMQGGGEVVVDCVGSLIVNGMAGGSYSPVRPYTVETRRLTMVRRFEQ